MQEILSGGGAGYSRNTKLEGDNMAGEGLSPQGMTRKG